MGGLPALLRLALLRFTTSRFVLGLALRVGAGRFPLHLAALLGLAAARLAERFVAA